MISIGNSVPFFAPTDEFDSRSDLLRQRFGRAARAVGDQPFREAFGNDVGYFLAEEFIAAVTELLFRLHVEQDDLAALVHHHHGVWRGFQQSAIPAFHLRQMFFRVFAHADVADRRSHQDSFRAFERAQHDLDWEIRFCFCAVR